ncbi:hypothetical protein BKA65DRAFT_502945 [Rhexocercosporidium sp. MPI-PUGE-AT-0058]|nr:hypothetical protein BKA65DRAFT_502945 [Rhexocercosporidium sp. MPI-PUGE-AT-0058]
MQRGSPHSVSTSRTMEGGQYQSSPRHPALPQSHSPHRTFSEPATSPTSSDFSHTTTRGSQSTVDTQISAGYGEKTLQFDPRNQASPIRESRDSMPSRRHSHDPAKVNGYTTCGRHGDDWLFGGFSVSGAVKKLWEKENKE